MHLFFINLGLESTWSPPHNNGLCYIILDFALSMSSCCSLRCRHSPPSSCENDCRKSSSEICNHLKSYYFTPKDSSTSRTTWSKSDPTTSVCQSQQEQNISTNSGHFPAGSSSVEIKATCWGIPIDLFWFCLWLEPIFILFFFFCKSHFCMICKKKVCLVF